MSICKGELDYVVWQCLIFGVYAETMAIDLIIFLSIPETQRIESFRDFVILTQSLLSRNDRKRPPRTYFDHKQLILCFIPWHIYLTHIEDHPILARHIVKFKPLLTDPLDSVGSSKRLRSNVDF